MDVIHTITYLYSLHLAPAHWVLHRLLLSGDVIITLPCTFKGKVVG